MKKTLKTLFILIILMIQASCATNVVRFQVDRPPLVDLYGVNTITVIPLEWSNQGRFNHLANDVTRALTTGVKRARGLNFVNPSKLRGINESDYWEYVDVFIRGRILNVSSHDVSNVREETRNGRIERVTYTTRTVTVDIQYRYIRAINLEVLAVFNRTETISTTFDNSRRAKRWWQNLLYDVFVPRGQPPDDLARAAISRFSAGIYRELVPWHSSERRRIKSSTKRDRRFNEAERLVRRNEYFLALIKYRNIFEETGSFVAGYNMALLLQANGQFAEALELLKKLDERLSASGINSPPFIRNEIENLNGIIEGFRVVEKYRNL
ncbi:MAG: hypothetical protein FWC36_02915 [Spirochaetes bacterium]|nr:hypothetical protein [Spirochaetota bacterium]